MAENEGPDAAQEELLSLLRQYKPRESITYGRDALSGRYRILTGQPLPELSTPSASAYIASDSQDPDKQVYALVHDNRTPIRHKNINILKDLQHPCLVSLLDSGLVDVSILSEVRYVTILERPRGEKLSQIFAEKRQQPVPQTVLINNMLRPVVEVLLAFVRSGISHNKINLDNVYINGDKIMLGECVSEPAGYSQDIMFEPVERLMTIPLAKPDFSISSDCYALGVLMLHFILGHRPLVIESEESYISDLLVKGSFNMLVVQWDFSEAMQDFFRGVLNDVRRERWDPENMNLWLNGRHFNLVAPSLPNEASRGFDYGGHVYYNRKALADVLFHGWPESHTVLSDNRLGRWVETSVRKPEAGEMMVRLAANASSDNVRYERQNSEAMARIVILLDPIGPIRLRHLSVMVDGIGNLLTNAFLNGVQEDIQVIVQMLESDLPWFWAEQNPGTDHTAALWRLQRVRTYMRIPASGFGPERCLYELNPTFPCQSRLVKRFHATTLRDLMIALDTIAAGRAKEDDCLDRHIAGFISAKLDIGREIRVSELEGVRKLSTSHALVGLKLLIRAQHKIDSLPLPGLAFWVALRVMPLLDTIHQRSERKRLKKELISVASSGILKDIADLLFNPRVFIADHNEFLKIVTHYQQNKKNIAELKDSVALMRHARVAGRGIAQTLAYGICIAIMYYTLRRYLHF